MAYRVDKYTLATGDAHLQRDMFCMSAVSSVGRGFTTGHSIQIVLTGIQSGKGRVSVHFAAAKSTTWQHSLTLHFYLLINYFYSL